MGAAYTPEVFLSYARSAEPEAKRIAEALEGLGYEVWWDEDLPAHRAYTEVIEERLNSAKAVLVVWSADAAKSEWVRAEADVARHSHKLVQLSIDGSLPPMPFNQIQCPSLRGWEGSTDDRTWIKIEASLAELVRGERRIAHDTADANSAPATGPTICVLPFINMSGDPEQEYFSDGITEDLITDLSKVSALGVVARNTSFTYKGQSVEARALGRDLRVSHMAVAIEGDFTGIIDGQRLCLRARANPAHLPGKDIEDLRQFIEPRSPEPNPDPGNARVAIAGDDIVEGAVCLAVSHGQGSRRHPRALSRSARGDRSAAI